MKATMKALVLAALALNTGNATAFTGDGNSRVDDARDYMNELNGKPHLLYGVGSWMGLVQGVSASHSDLNNVGAICYPRGAKAGQLAEIAAKYIIEHPEERTKLALDIITDAHTKAFGLARDKDCYKHQQWLDEMVFQKVLLRLYTAETEGS